jgi:Spy/CpxP family protein refolding chaperone
MNELAYGYLLARRLLLLAGVLVVAGCTLWAQSDAPPAGGPRHGYGPERELQQLTRALSLTADQQTQVKSLLTERMQKMQALRRPAGDAGAEASTPDGSARHAQMEAIRTDTDNKITALLNDDQKTKFAAYQQGRKDRMARWQGQGSERAPAPDQPNN